MLETPDKLELLQLVDILVDGSFDITKRTLCSSFEDHLINVLLMSKIS